MKCMKMIGGKGASCFFFQRNNGLTLFRKGEYAILDQLLEVVACDLLSDGHRLLGWLALAFLLHFKYSLDDHLDATGHFSHLLKGHTGAHFGANVHRRNEADLVEAIVHSHLHSLKTGNGLGIEEGREREGQESVRNGSAEGRLPLGALGVGVDPLPVARGVGEGVHALLGDFEPAADADLGADGLLHVFHAFEGLAGRRRAALDLVPQIVDVIRFEEAAVTQRPRYNMAADDVGSAGGELLLHIGCVFGLDQ